MAPATHAIYQPLLDAYLQWMRCYQHAVPGTLDLRARSLTQFLRWLGPDAVPRRLACLSCEKVEQFILAYAADKGRAARRAMQSALRTFLRFALHEGYLRQSLDRAVPTLRTYKLATVPHSLSEEQAQDVLRGIARDTEVGRRDYAILQLLWTYGVRGGQVCALCLEEIDWVQNQILFKAAKHGKDVRVPMTLEVGEAVLDYLRNGRPACSFPEVFLTSWLPIVPCPIRARLRPLSSVVFVLRPSDARAPMLFRQLTLLPHAPARLPAEGDRGHAQIAMAEHVRDRLQRAALLEHAGGETVPEGMGARAGKVDARSTKTTLDKGRKRARMGQGTIGSTAGQKDFRKGAGRTAVSQIIQDGLPHLQRHWHANVLAVLGGLEENLVLHPVDFFQTQGADLSAPHPIGPE